MSEEAESQRFKTKHLWIFQSVCLLFVFLPVVFAVVFTQFETTGVEDWSWAGGVQATSAQFRVRGPQGASRLFVVSTNEDLGQKNDRVFEQGLNFPGAVDAQSVSVTGLTPNTKYFFGQSANDGSIVWSGSFRTPVPEGTPMNFKIGAAGCSLTGSKSKAFEEIAKEEPFMMINAGDMHYADISEANSLDKRVSVFDRVLGSSTIQKLYSSVAMAYVWDDHDYCANNAKAACEGRVDARKSYQKAFPHYPLPAIAALNESSVDGLYNVSIYQSFTIGTVRFVLTDLRSDAWESSDSFQGSIMTDEQKQFLFEEFRNAKNYDFLVWVSSKPWIGESEIGGDSWQGYAKDREEVSQVIGETIGKEKQNLFVISSDAHMVAFDDGTNTDYSGNNTLNAGFPILQSGPLFNIGSTKGGPFTEGCHTKIAEMNSQYSIVEFETTGVPDGPCISFTSYRMTYADKPQVILSRRMCGNLLKTGAATEGSSCEKTYLGTTSLVFLILTLVFFLGLSVASCIVLPRKTAGVFVAMQLLFVLLAVGLGGAMVTGIAFATINAFNIQTFAIIIFCFLQVTVAVLFLVYMVVHSKRSVENKMNV